MRPAGRRLLVVQNSGVGRFFVGGNWKANGTKASVTKLVEVRSAVRVDLGCIRLLI